MKDTTVTMPLAEFDKLRNQEEALLKLREEIQTLFGEVEEYNDEEDEVISNIVVDMNKLKNFLHQFSSFWDFLSSDEIEILTKEDEKDDEHKNFA